MDNIHENTAYLTPPKPLNLLDRPNLLKRPASDIEFRFSCYIFIYVSTAWKRSNNL